MAATTSKTKYTRSKTSSETLNLPPQSGTPSSASSHDRFALLVIVSVFLGLVRNTMEYRVKWQKDHYSVSRDGLPTLIRWLQYQLQYALLLVFAYRIRTMGLKTLTAYSRLLLDELHHYRVTAPSHGPFALPPFFMFCQSCIPAKSNLDRIPRSLGYHFPFRCTPTASSRF